MRRQHRASTLLLCLNVLALVESFSLTHESKGSDSAQMLITSSLPHINGTISLPTHQQAQHTSHVPHQHIIVPRAVTSFPEQAAALSPHHATSFQHQSTFVPHHFHHHHRRSSRATSLRNIQQLLPAGPILTEGHTEKDDSRGTEGGGGGVVTYSNKSGVVLSCSARGDPIPRITWRHLDQSLVHDIPGVREVSSNSSLIIRPFSAPQFRQDVHAAVYQCAASNPTGTVLGAPYTLRPVVSQGVEVVVRDEAVMSGNTAVLTCEVPPSLHDLLKVSAWERDRGQRIYPSLHGDGKYHAIEGSGKLLVHRVDASDSHSTFRCVAVHSLHHTTAQSNAARIIVNDPRVPSPPRLITQSGSIEVPPDHPLLLPCVAHSNPPPSYRWYEKSASGERHPVVVPPDHPRLHQLGGPAAHEEGVLVLKANHPLLQKNTVLVCEASNSAGRSTMEVRVSRYSPSWVRIRPRVAVADVGGTAEFVCEVGNSDAGISTWGDYIGGRGSSSISGAQVVLGPGLVTGNTRTSQVASNSARFTWYKDGRMLAPSTRVNINGGTLRVGRVLKGDTGMYQCFARTPRATLQDAAELRLGASPPELVYEFITQTMRPGPSASLKCIARGTPTPVLTWTLDGFPLHHSDRLLVGQHVTAQGDVVGHVNITSVRVEDGGHYGCTATNTADSVTHEAPLHVYGPPYVRPVGSVTAVAGETFRVRCPVAGYPIHSIIWARDGRQLPVNRRQEVDSGGVLTIRQVSKKEDKGTYSCTATDKQRKVASQTMRLNIVVPPAIRPFEFGTVVAGMRSRVTCLVTLGDLPLSHQWLKDGMPLSSPELLDITITQLDDFTSGLFLPTVETRHAGNYTCVVRNPAREASYTAQLRVHEPPRWVQPPEGVSAVTGETAVLVCQASGFPAPMITWSRNNKGSSSLDYSAPGDVRTARFSPGPRLQSLSYMPSSFTRSSSIPSQTNLLPHHGLMSGAANAGGRRPQQATTGMIVGLPGATSYPNGSLVIVGVTEAAEGSYLCEANNGVGAGISEVLTLTVHAPPVISGRDRVEVRRGDDITISCMARGDPPLTLILTPPSDTDHRYKRGPAGSKVLTHQELSSTASTAADSHQTEEIRLSNAQPLDSGFFICHASNPYGQQTRRIQLLVQDVPSSPRDLRIVTEDSRSATVKWTASSSPNTPITSYSLQLRAISGDWDDWNSSRVRKLTADGAATSITLTDLLPATEYQVRVIAINSVGGSPPSEPLTLRTEGEAPSGAPRNLRGTPISSRSVRVAWTAPETSTWHGQLLGYYVGFRKVGTDEGYVFRTAPVRPQSTLSTPYHLPSPGLLNDVTDRRELTKHSNHKTGPDYNAIHAGYNLMGTSRVTKDSSHEHIQEWVVDELDKYSEYEFIVQAYNVIGPGPLSDPITAITLEDVPEAPPQKVKCTPLSSTRLQVSWAPPPTALTHGHITSYTLTYAPMDDHTGLPGSVSRVVDGPEAAISDLYRFTNYSVKVAASTRAGLGAASEPIICPTDMDAPMAPAGIKCIVSGPSSVMVAWKPPVRTHGPLTHYNLYYKARGTSQPSSRTLQYSTTHAEITGLLTGEPVQVWVTAATRAGEGPSSAVATATPSATIGAGVYAVGGLLKVPRGSDILLACPHLGDPKPAVTWIRSAEAQADRSEEQPDRGLLIRDCHRKDSGNYTCNVTNKHSSDYVTYSLLVMVPPSELQLSVLSSSSNSVTLQFGPIKPGPASSTPSTKAPKVISSSVDGYDDGGAPLRRLVLTWRRQGGEWREVEVGRTLTEYTLTGLNCGTLHHLYITPYNVIGAGAASKVVSVSTKGSRPPAPPQHRFIGSVNSTHASLRLSLLSSPDCSTTAVNIKIRRKSSPTWRDVDVSESKDLLLQSLVVGDLQSGETYELLVKAENPSGVTEAEYSFTTRSLEEVQHNSGVVHIDSRSLGPSTARDVFSDPAFIVPVLVSCLAVAAIVGALVFCWRRKPLDDMVDLRRKEGTTKASEAAQDKDESQLYSAVRKPPSSPGTRTDNSESIVPEYAEDIYPYATFQETLPADGGHQSFQTFVFRDPRLMPHSGPPKQEYRKGAELAGAPQHMTSDRRMRRQHHHQQSSLGRSSSVGYSLDGDLLTEDDLSVSDSDTEHPASSRTESSSHLEDGGGRNAHHNLLYVTSDASTIASPSQERRSLPRRLRSRSGGSGSYGAAVVMAKNARNATTKPNKSSSSNIIALCSSVGVNVLKGKPPKANKNSMLSSVHNQPSSNNDIWRVQQNTGEGIISTPHMLMQQNTHFSPIHKHPPSSSQHQQYSHELQETPNLHSDLQNQISHSKQMIHQQQNQAMRHHPPPPQYSPYHGVQAAEVRGSKDSKNNQRQQQQQHIGGRAPRNGANQSSNAMEVDQASEEDRLGSGRARQPTPTPHMISGSSGGGLESSPSGGMSEAGCDREGSVRKQRGRRNFSIAV